MRGDWWGEAPERSYNLTRAADGFLPDLSIRPEHAPSRDLALRHGSARFQAHQHRLANVIRCSGSMTMRFGSLAPPITSH